MTDSHTPLQGRSSRFPIWIFFSVCSAIHLGSSIELKNAHGNPSWSVKWAVACSAVSFTLTALAVLVHIFSVSSVLFVGSMIEGLVALLLVGLWAAMVSIVTNTHNHLSVVASATNQVSNANLYYFSWAGFVTSVLVMISYLRSAFGVDLVGALRERSARLSAWTGMIVCALVVMGSSLRVFLQDCSEEMDNGDTLESYCKRSKLGVAIGATGIGFSTLLVLIKLCCTSSRIPAKLEMASSVVLFLMNAVGVAYITSNNGPGRAIGNLYYSTWASLLTASFLVADCAQEFMAPLPSAESSILSEYGTEMDETAKPELPNDSPVMDLEDI